MRTELPTFYNIPFDPNWRFVGRGEQLEQLRSRFLNSRKARKIAITGLGGIGKTQIALQFAYQIRDEAHDCSIFWISAISREGLEQTYTDIVQKLRVPGWEDNGTDSKALLERYLSEKSAGRWLLIFDNADDIDMWLGKDGQQKGLVHQLPRSDEGCILLTTRDRKMAVKLAHQDVISVPDADEEMAMQLLHGYLGRKELTDNVQEVVKLLKELAFLPLAIVQAAAYINENETTLAKYLELLAEQEEDVVDLLSKDFEDEGRYHDMKNPVATTWLISFEQMRGRDALAVDYLSFMACIEPTDIPQSMLPAGKSKTQETDAIGLLKAYSFLIKKSVSTTLNMHRLVHLATRSWLRRGDHFAEWTMKARQQLSKVFPDHDHTNRSVWRLYLPHARRILRCEVYEGEEVNAQMQLLWKIAMCLYEDGKYDEAEDAFARAMEARKRVLGEEHPDTLSSMANLASTYWNQGRWKEAEELQVGVMETTKRVLGEEHPDTLTSMNNLAFTWKTQGQNTKAINLMSECVHLQTRILGANHPHTLSSSASFNEWQIEKSEGRSSATNKVAFTKGKPTRPYGASDHAIHSGSRRKGLLSTLRQNFRP